jgi:hypothetical protein
MGEATHVSFDVFNPVDASPFSPVRKANRVMMTLRSLHQANRLRSSLCSEAALPEP